MQKGEASIYEIKYRATGKLEMGKPFAFLFFRIWIWWSVRLEKK